MHAELSFWHFTKHAVVPKPVLKGIETEDGTRRTSGLHDPQYPSPS